MKQSDRKGFVALKSRHQTTAGAGEQGISEARWGSVNEKVEISIKDKHSNAFGRLRNLSLVSATKSKAETLFDGPRLMSHSISGKTAR